MRFQQLKKNPNAILKKKLYKSGKSWIIKSSLSFAGGLILFGTVQTINVKAATNDPTSTEQSNTGTDDTTQTDTVDSTTQINNQTSNRTSNQQNQSVTNNVRSANNDSTSRIQNNNQSESVQSSQNTQASSEVSEQPQQTAATSSVPSDAQSLGTSQFYVDDNKVLHITAGEYTADDYQQGQSSGSDGDGVSPFNPLKNSSAYNEVSFDGKVIAHGSVANMFNGVQTLTKIDNLDNLDTSDVTDFSGMFSGCSNLSYLDVSSLDTSKATDMSSMFNSLGSDLAKVDLEGLGKWNTSSVYTMSNMFASSQINGVLDLSNFTGDNLRSMNGMFTNSKSLTEVNLSHLNTPVLGDDTDRQINNNIALENAFSNCTELQKVDLSLFTGANVKSFSNLFSGDTKLSTIIMPKIDTSSATDLSSMFSRDQNLTSDTLDFLSKLNTSNVTNFNSMFNYCSSLSTLDLSSWNANKATNFNSMFESCTNLVTLKLPQFDNSQNSDKLDLTRMIELCSNLNELDFTNFVVPENSERNSMLNGTNNLLKLVLNSKVNLDGTSLSYVNIYKGWYNVGNVTDEHPEGEDLQDGNKMMSLYSNNSGPDDTWVIAERKFIPYTIKYVDYDTGEDLNYDTESSGRELLNHTILTVPSVSIPGYDVNTLYYNGDEYVVGDSINVKKMPDYDPDASPLVFIIRIKKYENFVINIGTQTSISLPIYNPSAVNNLDLTNIDNTKKLDPDATTIDFSLGKFTLTYMNTRWSSPVDNTRDLVIASINLFGGYGDSGIQGSGTITIDPVYIESPTNPGSSASGEDRVVEDISQTISTFSDRADVQLYDFNGNAISGKRLASNTDWQNDEKMTLNGIEYYRVSTDEWVKASDVYVYVEHNTMLRTYKKEKVPVSNVHLENVGSLDPATDWKSDRYAIINGAQYYRVSTNAFVPLDKVYEYQDSTKIVHSERATAIYDERGNSVGHTLISDQDYKTDKTVNINGENYYRVSTNEFVKESNVLFKS